MKIKIFLLLLAVSSTSLAFTSAEEKLQKNYKDKGIAGKAFVRSLKKEIKNILPVGACCKKIDFFYLWDCLRELFTVGLIIRLSEHGIDVVDDAAFCLAQRLFKRHENSFTKDCQVCSLKMAKDFQHWLLHAVFTWLFAQLSQYENSSFKFAHDNEQAGVIGKKYGHRSLFVVDIEKKRLGVKRRKNKLNFERMGYEDKSEIEGNIYDVLYDADTETEH